jgi:hypothetical protein
LDASNRLSTATSAILSRVARLALPMCGVPITVGNSNSESHSISVIHFAIVRVSPTA